MPVRSIAADLITSNLPLQDRRPDRGRASPGRRGQCQPDARPDRLSVRAARHARHPARRTGVHRRLYAAGRYRRAVELRRHHDQRKAGVRRRPHPHPAPLQARSNLRQPRGRRSAQGAGRDRPVLDRRGRAGRYRQGRARRHADRRHRGDSARRQDAVDRRDRGLQHRAGLARRGDLYRAQRFPARRRADRQRGRRHAGAGRVGDVPPLELAVSATAR